MILVDYNTCDTTTHGMFEWVQNTMFLEGFESAMIFRIAILDFVLQYSNQTIISFILA